jgi:hypothetical protein
VISGYHNWMSGPLVYSTNVFLKLLIQEKYRNDVHYVWCSEHFDSRTLSAYSSGSLIPPSSNPADIYRELQRDVQGLDSHSAKIAAQRAVFISLAIEWEQRGEISSNDKDDIIWMANNGSFAMWRPLVYVIPRAPVEIRLQLVPVNQRAGWGNEYIIPDLKRAEFDVIEL